MQSSRFVDVRQALGQEMYTVVFLNDYMPTIEDTPGKTNMPRFRTEWLEELKMDVDVAYIA